MTSAELKEATFVLAGYTTFAWVYYKFVRSWIKSSKKNKDLMIIKAYVCMMFTMPAGFFVLAILSNLYSVLFGGAR